MSTLRYRACKGMHPEAAGYMLAALAELANTGAHPTVKSGKQAREWAQNALAQMVAQGYIEPREVQP